MSDDKNELPRRDDLAGEVLVALEWPAIIQRMELRHGDFLHVRVGSDEFCPTEEDLDTVSAALRDCDVKSAAVLVTPYHVTIERVPRPGADEQLVATVPAECTPEDVESLEQSMENVALHAGIPPRRMRVQTEPVGEPAWSLATIDQVVLALNEGEALRSMGWTARVVDEQRIEVLKSAPRPPSIDDGWKNFRAVAGTERTYRHEPSGNEVIPAAGLSFDQIRKLFNRLDRSLGST